MTIHIISDSTSDIPQEMLKDLPISIIPLYITLNGKGYRDNVDLTRHEFYAQLPDSDPYPTTATPSPQQFLEIFNAAADQGAEAVFSIHISRSLSATIGAAEKAAEEFSRIPVHVIDSGNLSMAEGLIVISAALAAKEGKTEREVLALIESLIKRTYAYAKLETIDYLLRGGRMNAIQHSIVSILGIKPILKMNNHISKMEIASTKNKALQRVLNKGLEVAPKAEMIGITHANVPDQVKMIIDELKKAYPNMPEPLVSDVTPALGVHVGPGALCLNWIESKK